MNINELALKFSQLTAKGAMEQGLKKMFGLARGFALLAADALKLLDDFGEFFLVTVAAATTQDNALRYLY